MLSLPFTWARCDAALKKLAETYPFCRTELLAATAFQRPIRTLVIGTGPRKVLFTAAHHANEWITALVLLKYAENLAQALAGDGEIYGSKIFLAEGRDPADFYEIPLEEYEKLMEQEVQAYGGTETEG